MSENFRLENLIYFLSYFCQSIGILFQNSYVSANRFRIAGAKMRHFPIFLDLDGRVVSVSGAGETAIPKLRLLLKTGAKVEVYAEQVSDEVGKMSECGRLSIFERPLEEMDALRSSLIYAANNDRFEDRRVAEIGISTGTLVNIVDDLQGSDFITPAIVDRSPVTVAIGTEGAAPVLARGIKATVESLLPASIGALAKIGSSFREDAANLPAGRSRRNFWSRFYFSDGPRAFAEEGVEGATKALKRLASHARILPSEPGSVVFAATGRGDPDLLSHKTRKILHNADSVVFDAGVSNEVLELPRREAEFHESLNAGIDAANESDKTVEFMASRAERGELVVRLYSEFAAQQGKIRLEIDAMGRRGISFELIRHISDSINLPRAKANSTPQRKLAAALPSNGIRKPAAPNPRRRFQPSRKVAALIRRKASFASRQDFGRKSMASRR